MIVLDASVAVKWLMNEKDSAEAAAFLTGDEVLVAPSLILVEVPGAVSRAWREGRLTDVNAKAACDAWQGLIGQGIVGLLSVEKVLTRAIEMSFACRHTVADCVYLAAAEEFGAEVVTADRLMFERGQKVYSRITLLNAAA